MKKLTKWLSWLLMASLILVLVIVGGRNLYKKLGSQKVQITDVSYGVLPQSPLELGRSYSLEPDIEKLEPFLKNLYKISITYWKEGRYHQAITNIKEIINLNKRSLPAYFTLAEWMQTDFYIESVDPAEIASLYHEALNIDEGHPLVRNRLGEFLWKSGLKDSANLQFEMAGDLSPTYPDPYINKGTYLVESEQYAEAQYNYQLAISLLKGEAGSPYDGLAWVYYKQGKDDSAGMVVDYAKTVGVYNNQIQFVEALLWEVTENLDVAKKLLMNLIAKDSLNTQYLWALKTLGHKSPRAKLVESLQLVDRSWEEATEAIEILDPLVKRYPDNAVLWYALGQAYLKRDLNAHALNAFDFALAVDSSIEGLQASRATALEKNESQAPVTEMDRVENESIIQSNEIPEEDTMGLNRITLGHYLIPWGGTKNEIKMVHSFSKFKTDKKGNLVENFTDGDLNVQNHLGFQEDKLFAILVKVTDPAKGPQDLFGRTIGLNSKISGNGVSTGTSACKNKKPFQGVLWQNEDTIEYLIQYKHKTWEVILLRIEKQFVKKEAKLCDYVDIMNSPDWNG